MADFPHRTDHDLIHAESAIRRRGRCLAIIARAVAPFGVMAISWRD
jgi:hypothetical protein